MLTTKARQINRVLGAHTPLARIGAREVDRFVATRLAEKAKRTTIAKELSTLRGALVLARRRKEYTEDVRTVMPLDFSAKYVPRERVLSVGEAARLLEAFADKPHRRALIAFLLATGATYPSEVKNARRGDVGDRFVLLRGTKWEGRLRRVPVVPHARPWLALAKGYGPPFETWANIRRDLGEACEALGMKRISPNDLRRTFGKMLRLLGVEPQLIAPAMGHADGRMVERVYGKLTAEELAHLLDARLVQNRHSRRGTPQKPRRKAG